MTTKIADIFSNGKIAFSDVEIDYEVFNIDNSTLKQCLGTFTTPNFTHANYGKLDVRFKDGSIAKGAIIRFPDTDCHPCCEIGIELSDFECD